jgi:outer membrane protein TolC
VDAAYLRFQDPPALTLGTLGSFAPIPQNGYFLQFGIQQPLYTGGRVSGAIGAAEWGTRAAAARRAETEVELTVAVAHAHDTALLAQALLGVALEGEGVLDSATAVARARLAAGTADRLDLLRAQTRLASARAAVRSTRSTLAGAREQLAALIGLDPLTAPPVAGVLEPIRLALDSSAITLLLLKTRTSRPDLEALHSASQASEARARTASASLRPSAGVFLNSLLTHPELLTGRSRWSNRFYGGLIVRWPIFDFGAAAGRVSAARAEALRFRAEAERVARDASVRALAAIRDLARSEEDVAAGRENVTRAEQGLALAQDRYAEGVGIQLEVLEAEADLIRTRADLLQAIHAQRSAVVELRRAVGRPADAPLGISVPEKREDQ